MSHRLERVNDLLRASVAEIVAQELKDPRLDVALLSITEVDTSPDLRHARVYVSIMGDEEERRDAVRALNHSHAFIRHLLMPRLTMKRVPDLVFEADTRIAESARVQHLIDEVIADEQAQERADDG